MRKLLADQVLNGCSTVQRIGYASLCEYKYSQKGFRSFRSESSARSLDIGGEVLKVLPPAAVRTES